MVGSSEIVKKLNLSPHVEGGFYHKPFVIIRFASLLLNYPLNTRLIGLLAHQFTSYFHQGVCRKFIRFRWQKPGHFYLGEPITIVELNENEGSIKLTCLGQNLIENQQPQYTVPPNILFGSFPTHDITVSPEGAAAKAEPRDPETHYSLVGCTCAPAFQFHDFTLANRSQLISHFPNHQSLIALLTSSE